jgi:CheY-like chemotaxis protein
MGFIREKRDIDLLITDQVMPGMTGSELAEAVRRNRPDFPIIIMRNCRRDRRRPFRGSRADAWGLGRAKTGKGVSLSRV